MLVQTGFVSAGLAGGPASSR